MAHLPTALTLAAALALAAASALALAAPRSDGPARTGTGTEAPVTALDVLLYEDGTSAFALGGFRERRRVTDAPDVEEVTALFRGLEVEVDARAPIVDLGDGSEEAFERLDALRVDLAGAIGVVELRSFDPLERHDAPEMQTTHGDGSGVVIELPDIALINIPARATGRGLAALLVAPPDGRGPFALVDALPETMSEGLSSGQITRPGHGMPLIRIRRHELDLIRERLRARRVRGADGETETIRVGPGPVEAHVVVSRGAGAAASAD